MRRSDINIILGYNIAITLGRLHKCLKCAICKELTKSFYLSKYCERVNGKAALI